MTEGATPMSHNTSGAHVVVDSNQIDTHVDSEVNGEKSEHSIVVVRDEVALEEFNYDSETSVEETLEQPVSDAGVQETEPSEDRARDLELEKKVVVLNPRVLRITGDPRTVSRQSEFDDISNIRNMSTDSRSSLAASVFGALPEGDTVGCRTINVDGCTDTRESLTSMIRSRMSATAVASSDVRADSVRDTGDVVVDDRRQVPTIPESSVNALANSTLQATVIAACVDSARASEPRNDDDGGTQFIVMLLIVILSMMIMAIACNQLSYEFHTLLKRYRLSENASSAEIGISGDLDVEMDQVEQIPVIPLSKHDILGHEEVHPCEKVSVGYEQGFKAINEYTGSGCFYRSVARLQGFGLYETKVASAINIVHICKQENYGLVERGYLYMDGNEDLKGMIRVVGTHCYAMQNTDEVYRLLDRRPLSSWNTALNGEVSSDDDATPFSDEAKDTADKDPIESIEADSKQGDSVSGVVVHPVSDEQKFDPEVTTRLSGSRQQYEVLTSAQPAMNLAYCAVSGAESEGSEHTVCEHRNSKEPYYGPTLEWSDFFIPTIGDVSWRYDVQFCESDADVGVEEVTIGGAHVMVPRTRDIRNPKVDTSPRTFKEKLTLMRDFNMDDGSFYHCMSRIEGSLKFDMSVCCRDEVIESCERLNIALLLEDGLYYADRQVRDIRKVIVVDLTWTSFEIANKGEIEVALSLFKIRSLNELPGDLELPKPSNKSVETALQKSKLGMKISNESCFFKCMRELFGNGRPWTATLGVASPHHVTLLMKLTTGAIRQGNATYTAAFAVPRYVLVVKDNHCDIGKVVEQMRDFVSSASMEYCHLDEFSTELNGVIPQKDTGELMVTELRTSVERPYMMLVENQVQDAEVFVRTIDDAMSLNVLQIHDDETRSLCMLENLGYSCVEKRDLLTLTDKGVTVQDPNEYLTLEQSEMLDVSDERHMSMMEGYDVYLGFKSTPSGNISRAVTATVMVVSSMAILVLIAMHCPNGFDNCENLSFSSPGDIALAVLSIYGLSHGTWKFFKNRGERFEQQLKARRNKKRRGSYSKSRGNNEVPKGYIRRFLTCALLKSCFASNNESITCSNEIVLLNHSAVINSTYEQLTTGGFILGKSVDVTTSARCQPNVSNATDVIASCRLLQIVADRRRATSRCHVNVSNTTTSDVTKGDDLTNVTNSTNCSGEGTTDDASYWLVAMCCGMTSDDESSATMDLLLVDCEHEGNACNTKDELTDFVREQSCLYETLYDCSYVSNTTMHEQTCMSNERKGDESEKMSTLLMTMTLVFCAMFFWFLYARHNGLFACCPYDPTDDIAVDVRKASRARQCAVRNSVPCEVIGAVRVASNSGVSGVELATIHGAVSDEFVGTNPMTSGIAMDLRNANGDEPSANNRSSQKAIEISANSVKLRGEEGDDGHEMTMNAMQMLEARDVKLGVAPETGATNACFGTDGGTTIAELIRNLDELDPDPAKMVLQSDVETGGISADLGDEKSEPASEGTSATNAGVSAVKQRNESIRRNSNGIPNVVPSAVAVFLRKCSGVTSANTCDEDEHEFMIAIDDESRSCYYRHYAMSPDTIEIMLTILLWLVAVSLVTRTFMMLNSRRKLGSSMHQRMLKIGAYNVIPKFRWRRCLCSLTSNDARDKESNWFDRTIAPWLRHGNPLVREMQKADYTSRIKMTYNHESVGNSAMVKMQENAVRYYAKHGSNLESERVYRKPILDVAPYVSSSALDVRKPRPQTSVVTKVLAEMEFELALLNKMKRGVVRYKFVEHTVYRTAMKLRMMSMVSPLNKVIQCFTMIMIVTLIVLSYELYSNRMSGYDTAAHTYDCNDSGDERRCGIVAACYWDSNQWLAAILAAGMSTNANVYFAVLTLGYVFIILKSEVSDRRELRAALKELDEEYGTESTKLGATSRLVEDYISTKSKSRQMLSRMVDATERCRSSKRYSAGKDWNWFYLQNCPIVASDAMVTFNPNSEVLNKDSLMKHDFGYTGANLVDLVEQVQFDDATLAMAVHAEMYDIELRPMLAELTLRNMSSEFTESLSDDRLEYLAIGQLFENGEKPNVEKFLMMLSEYIGGSLGKGTCKDVNLSVHLSKGGWYNTNNLCSNSITLVLTNNSIAVLYNPTVVGDLQKMTSVKFRSTRSSWHNISTSKECVVWCGSHPNTGFRSLMSAVAYHSLLINSVAPKMIAVAIDMRQHVAVEMRQLKCVTAVNVKSLIDLHRNLNKLPMVREKDPVTESMNCRTISIGLLYSLVFDKSKDLVVVLSTKDPDTNGNYTCTIENVSSGPISRDSIVVFLNNDRTHYVMLSGMNERTDEIDVDDEKPSMVNRAWVMAMLERKSRVNAVDCDGIDRLKLMCETEMGRIKDEEKYSKRAPKLRSSRFCATSKGVSRNVSKSDVEMLQLVLLGAQLTPSVASTISNEVRKHCQLRSDTVMNTELMLEMLERALKKPMMLVLTLTLILVVFVTLLEMLIDACSSNKRKYMADAMKIVADDETTDEPRYERDAKEQISDETCVVGINLSPMHGDTRIGAWSCDSAQGSDMIGARSEVWPIRSRKWTIKKNGTSLNVGCDIHDLYNLNRAMKLRDVLDDETADRDVSNKLITYAMEVASTYGCCVHTKFYSFDDIMMTTISFDGSDCCFHKCMTMHGLSFKRFCVPDMWSDSAVTVRDVAMLDASNENFCIFFVRGDRRRAVLTRSKEDVSKCCNIFVHDGHAEYVVSVKRTSSTHESKQNVMYDVPVAEFGYSEERQVRGLEESGFANDQYRMLVNSFGDEKVMLPSVEVNGVEVLGDKRSAAERNTQWYDYLAGVSDASRFELLATLNETRTVYPMDSGANKRLNRLAVLDAKCRMLSSTMTNSAADKCRKSILEMLRIEVGTEINMLEDYVSESRHKSDLTMTAATSCHIFDATTIGSHSWKNSTPEEQFSCAWDGDDYVHIAGCHAEMQKKRKMFRDKVTSASCNGYWSKGRLRWSGKPTLLFFSAKVSFLRSRKLLDRYEKRIGELLDYDWETLVVTLVNGSPGCGKTTYIAENFVNDKDIFATETTANARDMRRNLPTCSADDIRTYDSIMLNGGKPAERVWFDEGLMPHAGAVLICAFELQANEINILGDKKQIPYICRLNGFECVHHKIIAKETIEQNWTYRLPKCDKRMISTYYPGIEMRSKTVGEPAKVRKIAGAKDVPTNADAYLLATQDEKAEFTSATGLPKEKVMTIHEAQGGTYPRVTVVRLRPQPLPIYESPPHVIVAISRHTDHLAYYSVDTTDGIAKAILQGEKCDDAVMEMIPKAEMYTPIYIGPLCIPYSKVLIKKQPINEDRMKHDVIKWMMSLGRISTDIPLIIRKRVFVVEPIRPSGAKPIIHRAIVQNLYDQLYKRVSEEKLALERMWTLKLPLDKSYIVNDTKVMLKLVKEMKQKTKMTPFFKTTMSAMNDTMASHISSIEARNGKVLYQDEPIRPGTEECIVSMFMITYIDPGVFQDLISRYLSTNKQFSANWVTMRTSDQWELCKSQKRTDHDETKFSSSLKTTGKPALTGKHMTSEQLYQVLASPPQTVHLAYCGVMRAISEVLKGSLKPKWLIQDEVTPLEVEGFLTKTLCRNEKVIPQEIDLEKFDKSQGKLALELDLMLCRVFGMYEGVSDDWGDGHRTTYLIFHEVGLKLKIKYQRKSGDLRTLMGNTTFTMMALAFTNDLTKALGGIFVGDDSTIFWPENVKPADCSTEMATLFNLTAKLEWFPEAVMFASKYIIPHEGVMRVVPCPLKFITRLGRYDIHCTEHSEAYFDSFIDNFYMYRDEGLRRKVSLAATRRYENNFEVRVENLDVFCDYIRMLLDDKLEFKKLWYGPRWVADRTMNANMLRQLMRPDTCVNWVELDNDL